MTLARAHLAPTGIRYAAILGMISEPIYLVDIIRWAAGAPPDPLTEELLLARADKHLPGGRNCTAPLTSQQLRALGVCAEEDPPA